jgi:hypothetical protein
MISLDALRSALVSPQPWSELDRLVRVELAEGRLTNQIRDELLGMEEAARGTPGFNDDSEEAFHDTIDALEGNCAARYAYQNPPVLPTEGEVANLPWWARVAFAARCANRVLPLLQESWPDISDDYLAEVLSSLKAATKAADQAVRDPEVAGIFRLGAADAAHHVSTRALNEGRERASKIAFVTALAINTAYAEDTPRQVNLAWGALAHAWNLLHESGKKVVREEFDRLKSLAEWQAWTNDTPVSQEVFGPLWRDGPPLGWPADLIPTPPTNFYIGVSQQESLEQRLVEETLNVFNALNEYHVSRGGQPLTLADLQPFVPALVPAGV